VELKSLASSDLDLIIEPYYPGSPPN